MKKNTIISIAILIIVIISIISIVFITQKRKNNEISQDYDIHDSNMIEEIKEDTNAEADTEMYEIVEEYDGRKIVQIRPNIQFDTVLAGIIKNDKPEENEIKDLTQKSPKKNGIWISEKSRNKFIEILKDNNITQFEIDNDGYLQSKEESDNNKYKKIQKAIKTDSLFILDISGKCYIRDDFTGEIVEYPFEEMDPDQVVEVYSNDNSEIIEITSNSTKKLTSHEILTDILLNLE